MKDPIRFSTKEFDREQSMRRLAWAKELWPKKHQAAPSGKTWGQVFLEKEGLSLEAFREKVRRYQDEK